MELCRTPLDELRRSLIHAYPERLVSAVDLRQGQRTLSFARDESQWFAAGLDSPAPRRFTGMLDGLLNLRAEAWLDGAGAAELDPRIELALRGSFGDPRRFALGRDPAGEVLVELPSGERARVAAELLEDALALFGP